MPLKQVPLSQLKNPAWRIFGKVVEREYALAREFTEKTGIPWPTGDETKVAAEWWRIIGASGYDGPFDPHLIASWMIAKSKKTKRVRTKRGKSPAWLPEVLVLLKDGLTRAEIARRLNISKTTLSRHPVVKQAVRDRVRTRQPHD